MVQKEWISEAFLLASFEFFSSAESEARYRGKRDLKAGLEETETAGCLCVRVGIGLGKNWVIL